MRYYIKQELFKNEQDDMIAKVNSLMHSFYLLPSKQIYLVNVEFIVFKLLLKCYLKVFNAFLHRNII